MEVNQNEDGDLIYSSGDVLTYLGLSITESSTTYHTSPVFPNISEKQDLRENAALFAGRNQGNLWLKRQELTAKDIGTDESLESGRILYVFSAFQAAQMYK